MKFALSLMLIIIVLGCAQFTILVATSTPSELPSVSRVLQYYHTAKALMPDELQELYAQEEAHVGDADDPERPLRVALLLTLQGTVFHDSDRAATLLQDYSQQADNDSDLRTLAF